MARTAPVFVALVAIVAATVGTELSISQGLEELNGKKLFERETFGGNGRTCETCHSKLTGTLSLADVQRIIGKADPDDRFLIHDALDDDGSARRESRRTERSASLSRCRHGSRWGTTQARGMSPSFAESHRL